jgi:hypothetical protein
VDKLKDVVTDVNNQQILNLALGRENEELKSKFEELQRSVVSRAVHRRPTGAYISSRIGALLFWYWLMQILTVTWYALIYT